MNEYFLGFQDAIKNVEAWGPGCTKRRLRKRLRKYAAFNFNPMQGGKMLNTAKVLGHKLMGPLDTGKQTYGKWISPMRQAFRTKPVSFSRINSGACVSKLRLIRGY